MFTNPKGFLTLIGVLLIAACTDNSVGVTGDASGTYTLATVNDTDLPFGFDVSLTQSDTIKAGTLTLNTDGTFSETFDIAEDVSGQTTNLTVTCTGTVVQQGGNFSFNETATADKRCGGAYGGSWDGSDAFSIAFNPSFVLFYTR